ncbi:MAG: hypothetical protein KJ634_12470 [Gammaproteobacteria bacterium]|nr:hypothetical protein [Gammaproteobacteria bacterium]MBU1416428.1 hypothetical protein [Gammaproteobacteria bacterium]
MHDIDDQAQDDSPGQILVVGLAEIGANLFRLDDGTLFVGSEVYGHRQEELSGSWVSAQIAVQPC